MKCCICGKEFPSFMCLNNPAGAAWKKNESIEMPEFKPEDKCCDDCNSKYVIPGRKYRMKLQEQMKQKQNEAE